MRRDHLNLLACPECGADLALVVGDDAGDVESGTLRCAGCAREYPVIRSIPRFVPLENYAASFGLEWTKHARTQYDSHSGVRVSEKRFFEETGWPRDLSGEVVLEVGSGSGRFTEQAASTNATVVTLDYSNAVEANYASNGGRGNVLIVQADIYRMPFRERFFDRLFCFGVLQHTPDVRGAFLALPRFLKSGGRIAVDVYRRRGLLRHALTTRYWVRPLTKRLRPPLLYAITNRYVRMMWPLARLIHRLPRGRSINWALLVADYRGVYDLREEILKEWAVLDTFDMLSPAFDRPQTLETVRGWFEEAGLEEIDVRYGYNGIEGRGVNRRSTL